VENWEAFLSAEAAQKGRWRSGAISEREGRWAVEGFAVEQERALARGFGL
jgi:hypothetical protein